MSKLRVIMKCDVHAARMIKIMYKNITAASHQVVTETIKSDVVKLTTHHTCVVHYKITEK